MQFHKINVLIISLSLISSVVGETPSYQILSYPFGNLSAATGGTRAINASGNFEVQGNPANTSFVNGIQGQAGIVNHLVGIRGYSVGAVIPMDRHRFSGEMIYFDYGLFDETDTQGNNINGSFGYHELASAFGYAFKFSDVIRLGGRVGRTQRVAYSQNQGDFYYDLGAAYHQEEDSLTVGVHLASVGLGESEESFPTQLHIGSSKILSHLPLRLNLEGVYGFNDELRFILGAEIYLHESFTVRLGMNSNRFDLQTGVTESDFIAGATAGFAINWQGLLIESATQSFGAAGWISQISLGFQI